jgi:hypothetical protein
VAEAVAEVHTTLVTQVVAEVADRLFVVLLTFLLLQLVQMFLLQSVAVELLFQEILIQTVAQAEIQHSVHL